MLRTYNLQYILQVGVQNWTKAADTLPINAIFAINQPTSLSSEHQMLRLPSICPITPQIKPISTYFGLPFIVVAPSELFQKAQVCNFCCWISLFLEVKSIWVSQNTELYKRFATFVAEGTQKQGKNDCISSRKSNWKHLWAKNSENPGKLEEFGRFWVDFGRNWKILGDFPQFSRDTDRYRPKRRAAIGLCKWWYIFVVYHASVCSIND